jgi:trimeric autotransporter adhesin
MGTVVRASILLALAAVAVGAPFARGVTPAAASFAAAPLPSVQTDGRVDAIVRVGGVVYLGGSFTTVTDSSGTPAMRSNAAAFDAATGALLPWDPEPNGPVHALAVSGPTIYLGGAFGFVGGVPRTAVAAVSSSGVLRPWSVTVGGGAVHALLVGNLRVYMGGTFTSVNGVPRKYLASVRESTGGLDRAFLARPDSTVWALRGNGSRIYVGGAFRFVSGRAAPHIAAVRYSTGALLPWASHPYDADVLALAQANGVVYAGLAGNGGRIASYVGSTGRKRWDMWLDGNVKALTLAGGQLIAGGHFTNVCAPGSGEPCLRPLLRPHILAARPTNGRLDPRFAPRLDSSLGVFALAGTPNLLYAGGDFTKAASVDAAHFAAFGVLPTLVARPALSGQAVEGDTLTATTGTWAGLPPITFTYQWERCAASCAPVSGQTGSGYAVTSADAGFQLHVVVTATNPAGQATAASPLTAVVG